MKKLFGFFKKKTVDRDLADLLNYYECEDIVEDALNWLDNHEDATLEEYEAWLEEREKLSKSDTKS